MYNDEELEAIRQKKFAQIQEQQAASQAQEEQKANLEAQKQSILRQILTEEARQRLANVKLVRPQVAEAVELRLIQIAQQGGVKEKINDEQLKEILRKIQGQKRETKVEIRRL
ncbi:MAG: DNA-binding protein [Candidatus Heimdallarchaeota archaeon]|jgi:programmed cell death protein 5|nr:DNA-binding protein [Candidatus Heimdallarchaeota archaeon]MCK4254525.1 DNA-binding protein [Candidatus Heimdallarchaeota archaeon]